MARLHRTLKQERSIRMSDFFETFALDSWTGPLDPDASRRAIAALESGKVIVLPNLAFELTGDEQAFLSPAWLDGSRKNISLEGSSVGGASGSPAELQGLAGMIRRYASQAGTLVNQLFPQYAPHLRAGRTSFRPGPVDRPRSWRKDDSRLHVDAFPSRPNYGERILRVFCNVHPAGEARVWRVGEPFEAAAHRFLPRLPRQWPGSAALLNALQITKSPRSGYDHLMLHLHDAMKADGDYQRNSPQQQVEFAPGTTWVCYSDQVLHAAMAGQYMFEQTLHLPIAGQYHPERAPLNVLERLTSRRLVARP